MSDVFTRSDRLKELVFNVKLQAPEWKVLFAVDGKKDVQALAAFLDMDPAEVHQTLSRLREMQLISPVGENAGSVTPEAETDLTERTTLDLESEFGKPFQPASAPEAPEGRPQSPEAPPEDVTVAGEETEAPAIGLTEETESEEDEDFDKLIGDLLEDTPRSADNATPFEEATDTAPETPVETEPEAFDLGSLFEDTTTEAEPSIEEMLGSLQDSATDESVEAEAPPERKAAPVEVGVAPTILVVDDSVVIRKMVEIALENENYHIVSVATGKEALNYLDEHDPDLIILDIMLSDMNGLDVLKAIKASKDIPVVMLSAKDTPRETTKAKQLGADDFIPKPFKDEELVGKIKELIQQ
ncbi:MAG: response regulator [Calditrichaeota bacterium]|nr:MAG: response regulator [Calditrichota bacterium]